MQDDRLIEEVQQASLDDKKRILRVALRAAEDNGNEDELLRHIVGLASFDATQAAFTEAISAGTDDAKQLLGAAVTQAPPDVKKFAVREAVGSSHDAAAKELMREAVSVAPPDATKAALTKAVRDAKRGDAQDLVTGVIDAAPTNTARAAVEDARISQETLDRIWLAIVNAFTYVLYGATVGLFLVVLLDVFFPVELAHVQMILTVFTTVAGILAGFITGQAVGTAKERTRANEG